MKEEIDRKTDICLLAFMKNPYNIQYFPDEYITEELVIKAVKERGFILEKIDEKYRTREVCLKAISHESGCDIRSIPQNILDKKICMKWLKSKPFVYMPLERIPLELWDYDICLAAVKLCGEELKRIPKEYIDETMCLTAVKQTKAALKYIPQEMFTAELTEKLNGIL